MTEQVNDTEAFCVAFTGPATIVGATEARARLLDALESGRDIAVDCSGVTEADLSFVQVLLAARRSAQSRRRHLTMVAPASGALLDTLLRAGLVGAVPHGLGTDETFWKGGAA